MQRIIITTHSGVIQAIEGIPEGVLIEVKAYDAQEEQDEATTFYTH